MVKERRPSADRLLGTANAHVSRADLTDDEVFCAGDSGWPWPDATVWVNPSDGRPFSLALDEDRTLRSHAPAPASTPMKVPVSPSFSRDDRTAGPVGIFRAEEEVTEEEGGWLPPHEFLAREKERSAATSVLEGAGRTLKGRDMSRLRDAVWSRTNFFG